MRGLIAAFVLLAGVASAQTVERLVFNSGLPRAPGYVNQVNGTTANLLVPTGANYVCFGADSPFYGCADSPGAARCGATRPTGTVTNGSAWDLAPTCYNLGYVSNSLITQVHVDPVSATVTAKFYQ